MINRMLSILLVLFVLTTTICMASELQPYKFNQYSDEQDSQAKPAKKQSSDPYSDFRKKASDLNCTDLNWLDGQYAQKLKDQGLDENKRTYYQNLRDIVKGIKSTKCGG